MFATASASASSRTSSVARTAATEKSFADQLVEAGVMFQVATRTTQLNYKPGEFDKLSADDKKKHAAAMKKHCEAFLPWAKKNIKGTNGKAPTKAQIDAKLNEYAKQYSKPGASWWKVF